MFGAFAPMPIRLGGSDATENWTAEQQSRVAADVVALFRASSLAVLTLTSTGSISSYHGQNGVGLGNAPSVVVNGAGDFTLNWAASYQGPLWVKTFHEGQVFPWNVQQVQVHASGAATVLPCAAAITLPTSVRVIFTGTGSATIEVWGSWIPLPQIGTYDGSPDKENSVTEGEATYASVWYQEIQGMRGSAFTKKPGTFVHCENLALARFWGYHAMRLPEKLRANSTPARSDERLPYWAEVLGVGTRPGEETWSLRQRCALAYKVALGPTFDRVNQAVAQLLGDTLVQVTFPPELPLSVTPPSTYWYPVNPGAPGSSLTGSPTGTWTSRRAKLLVEIQWLPTMTWAEFRELIDVQLWQLLDTLLPAWMTWTVYQDTGHLGFLLDISHLDIDGFDP